MLDAITLRTALNAVSHVLVVATSAFFLGCAYGPIATPDELNLPSINSIEDLKNHTVFSFAIMSDNKGDSPLNSAENARMVKMIRENNDQFVIGLGDHLKKGWNNSFLDMVKQDPWWNRNFYPNIADGENEYYGFSEADWAAGGQLLKDMNFVRHRNVKIRKNGSEYYAKIPINDYTVHLIQLHYPDSPAHASNAFPEDSRQYLITLLQNINKGPRDIIIAAAHSRTGFWVNLLNKEQRKIVMEKSDLVLSATTHYFQRKILADYRNSGALMINTGSVNYPLPVPGSHGGYVHVAVLEKPLRLVVQYINVEDDKIKLQDTRHAILKIIGGEISFIDF